MTDVINTREIVLAVLNEVLEEDKYSHIVLREVLEKYQYLEKRDRSFITQSGGRNPGKSHRDGLYHRSVFQREGFPYEAGHPQYPTDVGLSAEIYGYQCRTPPSATKA